MIETQKKTGDLGKASDGIDLEKKSSNLTMSIGHLDNKLNM